MAQKFNKNDYEKQLDFKDEKMSEKDEEKKIYVMDRFSAMDDDRTDYEDGWKRDELQVQADIPVRDDGKASVNIPIEQNIIEQKIGEKDKPVSYIIEPNGAADINLLEPIKYTMDYFIKKERVYEIVNEWKYEKGTYGTGILFSGVWSEVRRYSDTETEGGFYDASFKDSVELIWHIGLKNIDIWDFWMDEKALKIEDAMDCIIRENISIEDLRLRFGNESSFKYIYSVGTSPEEQEGLNDKDKQTDRNVELLHYYNKNTGSYAVIANRHWTIYNGKNTYAHGELPVAVAKEYPSLKSKYGISVPRKTRTSKPYINNLYKYALDKVHLWSGSVLLTGNEGVVDGEMYVEPWEITEWNFNGDVKDIQQLGFDSNTTGIERMIALMEDVNIQNTGINIKAPFVSTTDKVFIAKLQAQAKNARMNVPDMLEDIALDRALNLMLSNIMQFAPWLYAEKILNKWDGKIQEVKYKQIMIPDVEVKNQGKKKPTTFRRKTGWFWVFELRPEDIRSQVSLRLSTPSTRTILKALEEESFISYVQNLQTIAQINPEALKKVDMDGLFEQMNQIFGIDQDKMKVATETSERRRKAKGIIEGIKNIWTGLPFKEPTWDGPTITNTLKNEQTGQEERPTGF